MKAAGMKVAHTGKKLTQAQLDRGMEAKDQKLNRGKNPASWVEDEDLWEKAKDAASKTYEEDDEVYWPVVTHIYENMGGGIKSKDSKIKNAVKAEEHTGVADAHAAIAHEATGKTHGMSDKADESGHEDHHRSAMKAHQDAEVKHRRAADHYAKAGVDGKHEEHTRMADVHGAKAASHASFLANKASSGAKPKAVKAILQTGGPNSGDLEECPHCGEDVVMQECPGCDGEKPSLCPKCSWCGECDEQMIFHDHEELAEAKDSYRLASVRAEHGELTGKPSFSTLLCRVNQAIQEDDRWDKDKHGYPEGSPGDVEPWCVDILVPDDDGSMVAVIRTDDGKLVKHGFHWDGEKVTMDGGDSEETQPTTVYTRAIAEREKAVKAGGSAMGAAKGHAMRKSDKAKKATEEAHEASGKAHDSDEEDHHKEAMEAHDDAHDAHEAAYKAHSRIGSGAEIMDDHMQAMKMHRSMSDFHDSKLEDNSMAARANLDKDVVQCRDVGIKLSSDKWSQDKEVEFQWMPGGISTINAHYGGKGILLTVSCDEGTARVVQSSLDTWRERYPKLRPFGCVEHREEEAAIYPDKFLWKDEPEPGVFCAAVPSALGARNVNGRIHRSWSPSFTTDADYARAKDKGGVLIFPDGARGSKGNPAEITGVAFSVGSLTNKPAFKNILPVRAKQAQSNPQPGSKAGTNKKGDEMEQKVKFIKAHGEYKVGDIVELEGDELKSVLASGAAMELSAALAVEAKDAENKALRESVKANQKQIIKDKIVSAKNRRAIAPKDTAVEAKAYERLDKGADIELICELIDAMRPDPKLGGGLDQRITASTDPSDGHVRYGKLTLREAGLAYIDARKPMKDLIQAGNVEEALKLSLRASGLLRSHFMPVYAKGEDFLLEDVGEIVTAADTTDPNSQVGTLSTGLLLMRNLGYLKNKLGFMPYISTDLRNEPARFGQPILTRYVTPPNVLTYVPGVGYTSDATTITNANISATTGEAATQTSGTKTPSAPLTTDRTVTINKHKGVEITFPTTTLGSTIRNLFAEQQGAQFYSLAEQVNKDFLASALGTTWTGIIGNQFSLGANFGLPGLVAVKLRFSINKMPDTGRFILLHSAYHDQILVDSNLVTAKAIMSLVNRDMTALESGELPVLYGIHVLESQLSSALNGVLTNITDPTAILPGTNQVGFAGNSASMLFAARVPQDYTTVFKDIPATAAIEILTEPDSGLSIMFTKYIDHGLAQVSARCALMYGFAAGDLRQGFILTP